MSEKKKDADRGMRQDISASILELEKEELALKNITSANIQRGREVATSLMHLRQSVAASMSPGNMNLLTQVSQSQRDVWAQVSTQGAIPSVMSPLFVDTEQSREPPQAQPSEGTSTSDTVFTAETTKKRPRMEDTGSILEQNPLASFREAIRNIESAVGDSKTKLNREDKNKVSSNTNVILDLAAAVVAELALYKGKYEGIKETLRAQGTIKNDVAELTILTREISQAVLAGQNKNNPPIQRSYAGVASSKSSDTVTVDGISREVGTIQPTIIFYPKIPEGRTSEDTKKLLMSKLSPKTDGFKTVRLKSVKGAGVLVQTSSPTGLANIKKASEKLEDVMSVTPMGRLPKIVLYDVPRPQKDKESDFFTEIFMSNFSGKECLSKEDFLRTARRVSFFGKRDSPTVNMIATVHPEARRLLLDSGLCFIGWHACRVRDYVGATRCFKCHLYGHVLKNCSAEKETCRHCTESGHNFEDCPNKAQAAKCATCTRFGKKDDHPTGDRSCPAQVAAISAQVKMTDYGERK